MNPVVVKDLRQMWHRWWLGLGLPAWWGLYGYCAWLILADGHWDRLGMVHGVSVVNAVVVGAASALTLESHLGHIHLDAIMLRAIGYRRYLAGKLITTALITAAVYAPFVGLLLWGAFLGLVRGDWLLTPAADAIGMFAAASAVTVQSIIHAGARCRIRATLICLPVLVGGLALPLVLRQGIGGGPIGPPASVMWLGALLIAAGLMIHFAGRVRWYPAYGRRPLHAWFGLPDDFFRPPHHDRRQ